MLLVVYAMWMIMENVLFNLIALAVLVAVGCRNCNSEKFFINPHIELVLHTYGINVESKSPLS